MVDGGWCRKKKFLKKGGERIGGWFCLVCERFIIIIIIIGQRHKKKKKNIEI